MTPALAVVSSPNLASSYQEIFILISRLKLKKISLPDSARFRMQMRQALLDAQESARNLGYTSDDIRFASFAVVALVDETIMTSSNSAFREWARSPLMHDLFGTLKAGEQCFDHMQAALNRQETKAGIDLLEVYFLCLALGFRGRYDSAPPEYMRAWRDPMAEKIIRTRGGADPVNLSPSWRPTTNVEAPVASNTLTRLALICGVTVFLLCVLLGLVYHALLSRGAAELARYVPR